MEPVDAPADLLAERATYAAWAAPGRARRSSGYDALYIHIKGPDVPAHDGRAEDKRDVIARIDAAFFGELLPRIDLDRTIVAVTADHSTSCVRKAHTADPVPLLVSGGGCARTEPRRSASGRAPTGRSVRCAASRSSRGSRRCSGAETAARPTRSVRNPQVRSGVYWASVACRYEPEG